MKLLRKTTSAEVTWTSVSMRIAVSMVIAGSRNPALAAKGRRRGRSRGRGRSDYGHPEPLTIQACLSSLFR
jgi:hypothetical protein